MVVGGRELIDTLWNVNFVVGHVFYDFVSELIDTLWNVNVLCRLHSLTAAYRINRYIMECKWDFLCVLFVFSDRINRYIMECKFNFKLRKRDCLTLELIDTLWNVNGINFICPTVFSLELIDTLWNVNDDVFVFFVS